MVRGALPGLAAWAILVGLATVVAGCGGSGFRAPAPADGGETPAPAEGTARFRVDLQTRQVRVTPLSETRSAGRAVITGTAVGFRSTTLLDQPGSTGLKVLNVSLLNQWGITIGRTPDGATTGLRVLFSELTNASSFSDLRPLVRVSTVAGTGRAGGSDGPVGSATLSFPTGVAAASDGTLYVAENHRIRKVQNGFVSTLAGSGIPGGVDGVGATARFQSPFGVAVNPVDGTLFVSEFNGQRIRRVERDGRVTLVAGTGVAGDADGAGHTATFRNPTGIAVAASGAIYVAERGGHRIRKVVLRSGADPRSASSYVVSTWAGAGVAGSVDAPGTSAGFNSPQGVAAGPDGTLYVADTSNNKVRLITPSREVVTIAGTGAVGAADGAGNVATFASPVGIAFVNGALAVADQTAQRVRQVRLNAEGGGSPGSAASWLVQTLAGGPGAGSSDGDGTQARFDLLHLMAADRSGNLYVADRPNQKIRRVVPATGHFPLGAPGGVAAGEVRLASPDGVIPASVLGQNLPFIQYSGSLPPGALSVARPWVFAVPEGVTAFEFTVLVEADTATWAGPPSVLNPGPAGAGSPDAQVRTLVGGATEGYLDGPAGQARLSSANDVTTDGAGNVYFTDGNSQLIRRISKAGVVSTVAGVVLEPGSTDGIGTVARFTLPHGIAATRDGRTLYVTEFRRNSVRRIALTGTDPTNPAHWTVSTIAGSATEGAVDGPGTTATFSAPRGVAVDAAGSVYVTERTGNRVRLLLFVGGDPAQAANWRVRLVAGDNGAARGGVGTTDARGASARFDAPWAIAVGTGGVVYVADANNNRIRRIADPTTFGGGLVETFAGSARGYADGAGTAAMFSFPEGVAVDAAGFLYVADLSTRRVRRITPGGLVTTVAGSGVRGSTDGPGSVATFQAPSSVAVDSMGSLYVADITRIRLIQRVVGVGTQ